MLWAGGSRDRARCPDLRTKCAEIHRAGRLLCLGQGFPNGMPSLFLVLAAFAASPASSDSLALTAPSWSVTFPAVLWRVADTAAPGASHTLSDTRGHQLALSGGALTAGSDVDSALLAAAAQALAAPASRLARTLDSSEALGSHAFIVREWRDPAGPSQDSSRRARVYFARRGDHHFLATLRYRSGGCSSTLFSLRESLKSLVLGDPLAAAVRRPAVSVRFDAPRHDALGRRRDDPSAFRWSTAARNREGIGPPQAKPAAPACADLP